MTATGAAKPGGPRRILVTTTFFPPVAFGGYEVECAGVVDRLREDHEVLVLTASRGAAEAGPETGVRRTLPLLSPDPRGSLRAPAAALRGAQIAREAMWNGSDLPQSTLRVLADTGVPVAVRVCEHWFGRLFSGDQFLRELLPADRTVGRAAWSALCRSVNRLPGLRLDPLAPMPIAISWNSSAIARMAPPPSFLTPVLEETLHSVPRWGDVFARVARPSQPLTRDVVFVGRVTPYKGVDVAIDALAQLRARTVPDARLIVIGPEEGDYGTRLRHQAVSLGIADAILWLGACTPEETAAQLAGAAALIVPSTWDEPFPLVTIEGALARVPVVASDVGGISEGMRDEEHALLFARGDGAGAARALARALTETAATEERVNRAYEHAQQYRIEPYLDAQAEFVRRAYGALTRSR
jgi:glycosyltransferase involved in cell wall biosynthesis